MLVTQKYISYITILVQHINIKYIYNLSITQDLCNDKPKVTTDLVLSYLERLLIVGTG